MTRTILAVTIVCALVSRARAQSDEKDPGELMDTGLAAYQAGDYAAAIAAFRAAYAADERPAALFAMAQAERKSGDCKAAVVDYDRFLATAPAERQADAARASQKICADKLATSEPIAPPPPRDEHPALAPPAALSVPAPPLARTAAPARAAWYDDRLADGFAGGAALGALVGAGFAFASSSAAHDANTAETYALHASRADAAARDRDVAIGAFAGAAVLGGLAAWRIVRGAHDEPDDRVAIVPGPGLGLAITGGF